MRHYIERFRFLHHIDDVLNPLRNDIQSTIHALTDDPSLTQDQRDALERKLVDLQSQHVTLQIRDAYLQVISRSKGWPNPWEQLGVDHFDDKTDQDLIEYLDTYRRMKRAVRWVKKDQEIARRRAAKAALIWHRPSALIDRYKIIDGRLHEVRERTTLEGETVREVSPHPIRSTSICYRGERISISGYVSLMTTGLPVRQGRPPKGTRYKAQVREGSRVIHLGMFNSPEERDAAVLNHRLGLSVNPAP